MGLYIGIYGLFAFLSVYELFFIKNSRRSAVFQGIVIAVLLILTAVRGGPYGDYYNYKDIFEVYTVTDTFFVKRNFIFEPLYSVIQWLCKIIWDNFIFFEIILGMIVIFSEHNYAKSYIEYGKKEQNQRGQYYFTMMYFLWGLYKCNVFFIRSSIAWVICLNGLKYIQKKDFKRFAVLVLTAAGFHYSALIFVPAYFIYHWHSRVSTKTIVFLAGTAGLAVSMTAMIRLAVMVIGGDYGNKLSAYLQGDGLGYGIYSTGSSSLLSFLLRILLNIGVLVFAGMYLQMTNKRDKYLEGYFNLYLTGSVLYIASLFSVGYAFARISIYYNAVQVPMLMSFFQKKEWGKKNRQIYWMLISAYLFARFYMNSIDEPLIPFWQ